MSLAREKATLTSCDVVEGSSSLTRSESVTICGATLSSVMSSDTAGAAVVVLPARSRNCAYTVRVTLSLSSGLERVHGPCVGA